MKSNSKLAVGIIVFVAFFVYVYSYSNLQTWYSKIFPKTLSSSEKEHAKREHEFPSLFSFNTPITTNILHNTTTSNQKAVFTQGSGGSIKSDIHDISHIYDDITKKKEKVGTELRRNLNISSLPRELYKRAKNIFDFLPKAYLPGYKSPCWKQDGALRCLNYFYLLGMPKCGTSDLWGKILSHPDVKYTEKEPHWWARHRLEQWSGRSERRTLLAYTSRSRKMVEKFALKPSLKSKLIIGDGSASTFWDNALWETWDGRRYEGPQYVTADVLHAAQPDAKLIVILRNPVDRVYSGYLYFNPMRHVKTNPEHFHSEIEQVIARFNKCLQTMSFRGCTYSNNRIHNRHLHARVLVGLYAVYVRDWLRVYPRDQLKIIRLEDWHENCTGLLPEVYDFLHLEMTSAKVISEYCRKKTKNTNKVKLKVNGDMLPKTRKLLEDFYEGPNKELSLLLESDKYLWRS